MTMAEQASDKDSLLRSLWDATSDEFRHSSPIEPDSRVDVMIIGGGIAGAVAFAGLTAAGVDVALLEARSLASGATGRSAGFIVPAFPAVSPRSVLESHGDQGEKLVAAVAGSADLVFELARDHDVDCSAAQRGWYQPVVSEKKLRDLEIDAATWGRFGGRTTLLTGRETEELTGVRGYAGSCRFDSGGTIHPVKFVQGLVRAAVARGGRVLDRTSVRSLQRGGGRWRVEASDFALSADKVLVCTNGQSAQLTPDLARSLIRVVVCQSATHPIPAPDRSHLFGQGSCLSDSRVNLFTYRFDPDWRLVSGCFPLPWAGNGRRITRRLHKVLRLPSPVRQEYTWFGKASVTEDYLPRVCEIGPGAYAFTACNGRGLALSSIMAHLLSTALVTGSFDDVPVSPTAPAPYRRRILAGLGVRLYPAYGAIADRLAATAR